MERNSIKTGNNKQFLPCIPRIVNEWKNTTMKITPRTALSRYVVACLSWMLLALLQATPSFAAEFLDPEQAFVLKAELKDNKQAVLRWNIATGYKLYRDKIGVSIKDGSAELAAPVIPPGTPFVDPTTDEKLEIYHDSLRVDVPITKASGKFTLAVTYQGCAEDGLCYPPTKKFFTVDPAKPGLLSLADEAGSASTAQSTTTTDNKSTVAASTESSGNQLSVVAETLASGSLWKVSLAFLIFGLLLSFTPCVLPMVPILSSIIVGKGEVTKAKSFLMALSYCFGMALVYTSLGVAAGLAGEGLAGALQKPEVLITFALLLLFLSLSMFDVYQLQLPASLQGKLNQASGNLKGGQFVGVFFMGALSALIVGPCVAAPLAGTLLYISQTKDVFLGGLALFSMAMGMSVPLLLVGLSAGSLLPKAGAWMIGVKYVFGMLLIAVAIWIVSPVLAPQLALLLWGIFGILCAVFMGVFSQPSGKETVGQKFLRTFGILLLLVGSMEIIGAASGSTNMLEPLAGLRGSGTVATAAGNGEVHFKRIKTVEELDAALASTTKPVMLDFYADWCISCKEMDKFTFSNPAVKQRLATMTLLQADVTGNTAEDVALMKRFSLFGPPGMIFFNAKGTEISESKLVGFLEADLFLKHLDTYLK